MLEIFKYIHGINKREPIVSLSNTRTKGHSLNMKKLYSRLELWPNLFGLRVVDLWNDLPECVVTADRVNSFKC